MVAIYARQSIDKKDSISIESQIEYCKTKLLPNEEFTVYEDKGFSGKNTERPKFLKMMKDIEKGRITKVIIYKLDRISRAILDFANMMNVFSKYGVSIISCSDPIDTSTAMGRALLTIIMTFAQLERETIQQRIKDNYYTRGRQGYYLGGRAPFGYEKIQTVLNGKKTYTFEPKYDQANQVCELFSEYGNTSVSLGKLANKLTASGVKTNSQGVWSGVSLGRLLRNPVYVKANADVYMYLKSKGATMNNDVSEYIGEKGCYVYAERKNVSTSKFSDLSKSYVTLALHKGLISSELWLQCQYKLDKNKQVKNSGKGTHSWLSGLLKCGYCNMAINAVNNNRGSNYINCGGRKLRICFKRKKVIKIEQIEEVVKEQLIYRIRMIKERGTPPDLEDSLAINRLKIQLVQIEEKIDNYMRQIENANNVVMQYINQNVAELDMKKKDLVSQIMKLSTRESKPNYEGIDINHCIENWNQFALEERKKIAYIFIENVFVTDDEIKIKFY
jgi:DNA invertase Pin-like site-specific DNA recombinase